MKKILLHGVFIFGIFGALCALYFFAGTAPKVEHIAWGVNFSQTHAQNLGLNWKEVFSAFLDDLKVTRLKISADWDILEPAQNEFSFHDLDWQLQQATEHGATVLLVIGMKTLRWPECHIPNWAKNLSKNDQQAAILSLLRSVVLRYKDSLAIGGWQIENEPFLAFGQCPWHDESFLKKEVELVRSLDSSHPVLISDSGELSLWIKAASYGDIVGTTLYRKVWSATSNQYVTYALPPVFYWRRTQLIHWLFKKDVIGVELQAEPWGPGKLLYDTPLEEQKKTMDAQQFQENIEYAKRTGFEEQYLWGGEWWYWMKEKQNDESMWNEAKKLFAQP